MASPPTGTLTFLFTDIEGSTRLWEHDAPAMQAALARHDELLRGAIEERGGYVFKTIGDAFCAAFPTGPDALEAALVAQRELFAEAWDEEIGTLRVRMALHTGAAEERDGDYFGPPLNRVARLLSAAYGGQVLLSLTTQELVRDQLPADVELWDLGEHRLKDLGRPEHIFQPAASGLAADFPPLRTLDVHLNNLPVQPTPLVGREREVSEVAERVRSEEVRLLTLIGPGGTGKTRLGLQAAADLLEEFSDGVFFVALATITEPELVASTIARALGVKESAEQSLMESLKNYLRDRRLLLVLDNFEQVLRGAPLVGELMGACPKLKVLATSRISLRLYGEQEYLVPPLALPDPRVMLPLEVLTHYEAVKLFGQRVRAVKSDFEVTTENAPAVAEICARLDGLPLAIELAAARVKVLTPQKMLDRLSDRLKLLTGGARDLPERQRTLRATMEWSHALLEEGERALFARLSVFAGGRTLEAIEAVCNADGTLPIDVLDGVESLVDKSLLREEEGVGGEPRFVMLETVHEYTREKLEESGEAEELRRRHAQYFLALAEEAEPDLKGPRQYTWVERDAEARHPGADRSVLVEEHVRLERGKSHLAGILARSPNTVEVRDGGSVERRMVDAPARAVRPVDGNDVPLLPTKQVVDGHAQSLGFGVQQRIFYGTERLGAQSVRSGSRGSRKGGVEALMVVYRLADQSVSIPLDEGREPGRPEGLVEFAPAHHPVIGEELEKVIVTPSGIAGQRFDALDFHRLELSFRAGSSSTASRSLYLSTRHPRFAQGHQKLLLGGRPRSARRAHGAYMMPG